mmetsp:Transcript_116799/g.302719  ORF Transcript_116799/g.302719 Transcript_116799/m.302719 type:complete len:439 (-) Transcript_116799:279-1595(-)
MLRCPRPYRSRREPLCGAKLEACLNSRLCARVASMADTHCNRLIHRGLREKVLVTISSDKCPCIGDSGIIQGLNAREHLALKELERGAATRGDEVDLVLHVPLGGRCGGVPTTDDALATLLRELSHGLKQRLRALGEGVELEDAGRAVPDHGLGAHHGLAEESHGLGPTVHALPICRDALLLLHCHGRLVVLELLATEPVLGQHDLNTLGLRLLHQLRHKVRTVLVEERLADLHAKANLQEGVGHAAAEDELVRLVDEVLDHKDLVGDLGAADNGRERTLNLAGVEDLREGIELLGDKEAGHAGHQTLHRHHGGVGAVSRAEGIVHVDVAELGEGVTESCRLLRGGLELGASEALGLALGAWAALLVVDTLALLRHVPAEVLEQDDGARSGVRAGSLDLGAAAIAQEGHGGAHELLEFLRDRLQRHLGLRTAVRTAQV